MYLNRPPLVSVPSTTFNPPTESRSVPASHLNQMQHGASQPKPPVSTRELAAYNKLRSELKSHGIGVGVNRSPQRSCENKARFCSACHSVHGPSSCPLVLARRREICGSCGIAHYGFVRKCPSLASAGQIRYMLDELRNRTEPKEHIELARAVLTRELRRKV